MAKRACPFEDNCAPQRKIHITSDDIARRDELYMMSIYDKTRAKLYNGVNNNNNRGSIESKENQTKDIVPANRLCIECNEIKYIQGNCWFCEVSLCQKCIKNCSLCSELFCSRCCVAIFKNGNNYSCLTCYS